MYRLARSAALSVSAAFVFCAQSYAQAPVVDASPAIDVLVARPAAANVPTAAQPIPSPAQPVAGPPETAQGELFYQLQLLQQEVMQLRGIVEEQAHEIKTLKQQGMDRYIDLDQRIAGLMPRSPSASGSAGSAISSTDVVDLVPAQPLAGEKQAYDAAYALVVERRFDQALEAFQQFTQQFPSGRYMPNSLYWQGELYQVVQPADLEASRQAFVQLLEQYPEHAKAPDAMYKLGKVYFQKGNKAAAREWMDRVIAQYDDSVSSAPSKARQFIKHNF